MSATSSADWKSVVREDAGAGGEDPGADQLAGLDQVLVGEHVVGRSSAGPGRWSRRRRGWRRSSRPRSRARPRRSQGWAWMSMKPGMIVFPLASMIFASSGGFADPSRRRQRFGHRVTMTSPCSMTSSPFIVMIRAPRSTTVPEGTSRGTSIATSVRCGSSPELGQGIYPRLGGRSGFPLAVSALSESARIESVRAFALSSESTTDRTAAEEGMPDGPDDALGAVGSRR